MTWFNTYNSNTLAGSGNQSYFLTGDADTHIGRIYYKVYAGGKYKYSLLFSNIIDSTFADGSHSYCNLMCDKWEIKKATVGVSKTCSVTGAGDVEQISPVTFDGCGYKVVMPGKFFCTDPVELLAKKGEYICVEIEFCGKMIPHHEESILPTFVKKNGTWIPSKQLPFPSMVGCDRKVQGKIGFLGDSITQGIGTPDNAYLHWNALVAEEIGENYSYWNLGLGYGRASDAASEGFWLYKAKQMDMIVMCYGINDIIQGREEEQIKRDLLTIILSLQRAGIKVMIQSLPPFDFQGAELEKWLHINQYVREILSKCADSFFDVVPILIEGEERAGKAKYNGHPNEEGCKLWADALTPAMRDFILNNEKNF